MTEREIIKALECCKDNNCNECPIKGCTEDIFVEALDLIDRKKAEIERLEKEIKDKERAYNDEFCSRKEWQSKCRELLKEKQNIKSEEKMEH